MDETLDEMELEERIEELELITEDERNDEGTELDEGALEDGTDDETTLDEAEDTAPQIAPVTAGVSIAPPLAFTCTPKETFCPGWIVPFQFRLVAA